MSKGKPRIGDVMQLSLPNGMYAYGRQLRDGAVAFYRELTVLSREAPYREPRLSVCRRGL